MKIIFIHGLGQNKSTWNKIVNEFDGQDDIICLDLYTHFKEKFSNYNDLYNEFKKYLSKYDEVILIGISLGGILITDYLIENPKNVKKAVIIGSVYKIPKLLFKMQNIIFKLLPNRTFNSMGISKNEVISLTESMTKINFTNKLDKIKTPVLIVCGDKDNVNKKSAKLLNKNFMNSKLIFIKNSKHEVNIEKPVELGNKIKTFLRD